MSQKAVIVILSIALVVCAAFGYFAYEHLERKITQEQQQRKDYEMVTNCVLSLYVETLNAIERRQTSVENIIQHRKDLDVALGQIRTYNASARAKRPRRKRNLAVGGGK